MVDKHSEALASLKAAIDLLSDSHESAEPGMTLGELYELYFHQHVLVKCKNPANFKYWASKHLDRWRDVEVSSIRSSDLQKWLDELGTSSQSAANRALHTLAAIINWGSRREHVVLKNDINPCRRVEKFKNRSRERFLTRVELERLHQAIAVEPETVCDLIMMFLATGQRKSNVFSMEWNEIDLDSALWIIPASKFKNGDSCTVALNAAALAVLERRLKHTNSQWVFPGRWQGQHIVCIKKPWARIIKRAGIVDATLHDLRRTVASHMAISGASPYVIGKALGHKDPRSTAVYARLDLQAVRDMQETISPALFGREIQSKREQKKGSSESYDAEILSISVIEEGESQQALNDHQPRPKNAELKIRPYEQTIIEGKILTAIRHKAGTRKAFYKKIGGQFQVNSREMDRILAEMESRGLIVSIPDALNRNIVRYVIPQEEPEMTLAIAPRRMDTPRKS